ncbi:hypothetical protein PsAD46_01366 [Pseudovibrio sp. Ad46]|uniref:hypothetical protein n=1 Tax=Pseudovibrio sp. Ad46 TaxID=989432 RepID=UPI0007AE61B1|nr:hypothetical protein [Pseudovibrio sp. Ad46]KZK91839.1 hypothetical protein PsAD46_01366 [Pseudovibrio sp. Ad46]
MRDPSKKHRIKKNKTMHVIDVAQRLQRFFAKFCRAGLLAGLFTFSSLTQAEEIRAFWDIEDPELENYVDSLIYLRDVLTLDGTEADNSGINFIFLSGSNYVNERGLNTKLIADVLKIPDPQPFNEYLDTKDRCLILEVNISDAEDAILAVNGTEKTIQPADYKCAALALLKFEGIAPLSSDTSTIKEITKKIVEHYLEASANE